MTNPKPGQQYHSTFEGVVKWEGGRQALRKGQTIADDHPLLAARPDLFELRDASPEIKTPGQVIPDLNAELPVERGTRAPGERRGRLGHGPK